MAVTLLSVNAKGLNSPFKRAMFWKEAKSSSADILCAQETHFRSSALPRMHHRNFPHIFLACSDKKRAGVLVAIRDTITFNLHQLISDPRGRYIILVCDINNIPCTLVTVYAPNTHQISFLTKLWKKIKRIKKGDLMWCGHFNIINEASMDSTSRSVRPPPPAKHLASQI